MSTDPPEAATPDAISNELNPAINTPIKFTKSLPANESARAEVPARIMILRILTLKICCNAAIITVQPNIV